MKKVAILSLILVFAFAMTAFASDKAKIDQGTGYVGVATGLALANPYAIDVNASYGDHSYNFSPAFNNTVYGGYFVMDGLEVGGILTLNYSKDSYEVSPESGDSQTDTDTTSLFGIGVQIGYFFDTGTFMTPYAMLGLEYAMYNNEMETEVGSSTTTNTMDMSGILVMPKGGLAFFVTRNFALDTSLYIQYASLSGTYETDNGNSTAESDVEGSSMDVGFMMGASFFF